MRPGAQPASPPRVWGRPGTMAALGSLTAGLMAVVVVAAASRLLPETETTGAGSTPPSPQLAGQLVVTSYEIGGRTLVLNPSTGDYREVTGTDPVVSPDLRLVASHHAGAILVTSTTDGGTRTIEVPEPVSSVVEHPLVWSPDSTMLVATTPYEVTAPEWPSHHAVSADGSGGVLPPFYRLVLVDVPAGTARLVNLGLPRWYHSYGTTRTGRIGAFGGVPVWLDDTLLAAPVTSLPPDAADIVNGDTIGVFDLTGALIRDADLPDGDLAQWRTLPPDYRLRLAGPTPDGSFLLLGPAGDATIALRGLPDPDSAGEEFAWRFDLPEPPDGAMWIPRAGGWLSGTEVLVHADQVLIPGTAGGGRVAAGGYQSVVVDTATGAVRAADALVMPDPAARPLTIGPAQWLSPAAAHLAFGR